MNLYVIWRLTAKMANVSYINLKLGIERDGQMQMQILSLKSIIWMSSRTGESGGKYNKTF